MRPNRSTHAAAAASVSAAMLTSQCTDAIGPSAASSATQVTAEASSTSATSTLAPSRRNRSAYARPMPRLPPVTIATRPTSRMASV